MATSEITYHGIPRNKIPWDPRINYEKCISCGKCFDFCHVNAFRLEEKNSKKRIVVNPNRCIVFCRGCQAICPEGAITHPSEEETQKIIDELKGRKNFRIKTWQEFKDLAYSNNAKTVVYVIAQSVPARDHTGLKLILPVERAQYIFTDSAKGENMRKTRIPIHKNKRGEHFLTDEDVKRFLRKELEIKDLKIFSYWTA